MRVLTGREASIFACLVDTVVAPAAPLPAVRATDAVRAFDAGLERAPRVNRLAVRVALYALEAGPRFTAARGRLRRLQPDARLAFLLRMERIRVPGPRQVVEALRSAAALSYYGDARVMRILGYDAAVRVARGRELRCRGGAR
jgi:hypothetical protein